MASSPLQITAADMAGDWTLASPDLGRSCAVSLSADGAGPLRPASASPECLHGLGLGPIAAWWPDTDGIALAAADGALQVFLALRAKGQFEGRIADGVVLRLARP
jgi:hypothetical protein